MKMHTDIKYITIDTHAMNLSIITCWQDTLRVCVCAFAKITLGITELIQLHTGLVHV